MSPETAGTASPPAFPAKSSVPFDERPDRVRDKLDGDRGQQQARDPGKQQNPRFTQDTQDHDTVAHERTPPRTAASSCRSAARLVGRPRPATGGGLPFRSLEQPVVLIRGGRVPAQLVTELAGSVMIARSGDDQVEGGGEC